SARPPQTRPIDQIDGRPCRPAAVPAAGAAAMALVRAASAGNPLLTYPQTAAPSRVAPSSNSPRPQREGERGSQGREGEDVSTAGKDGGDPRRGPPPDGLVPPSRGTTAKKGSIISSPGDVRATLRPAARRNPPVPKCGLQARLEESFLTAGIRDWCRLASVVRDRRRPTQSPSHPFLFSPSGNGWVGGWVFLKKSSNLHLCIPTLGLNTPTHPPTRFWFLLLGHDPCRAGGLGGERESEAMQQSDDKGAGWYPRTSGVRLCSKSPLCAAALSQGREGFPDGRSIVAPRGVRAPPRGSPTPGCEIRSFRSAGSAAREASRTERVPRGSPITARTRLGFLKETSLLTGTVSEIKGERNLLG
ncbi:hypothetical protein THAOC_00190, partial [Thalassiosira oceanica]